ncbi:hypothetical protein C8R31_107116 [Nitrosospira sp. Nsp2]|uniref:hypothetical protein n=1 Tax=Nitrosospira sp. Nsp2 TaxID=136548 RepID=UPI000D30F3E5|nr:hypothetical protein [Nitrosospira sp. Nsp2]PTR14221.1 hypothetical protein C8R31_107116 [Nitrosospira sp. Nsp2]
MSSSSFFDLVVKSPLLRIFEWWTTSYATKTIVTMLIVIGPVATVSCAAELTYTTTDASPGLAQTKEKVGETRDRAADEENRRRIRKENDAKSNARELYYPQQAASLAKQYKETAAVVARQGGDPQPLLDAAAYFESLSK